MKGPGGKGQGKPGRGKGKGKGSGAGVGSTYANPGRPKSFQPTQQDRQRTGNIAEHFRRTENTPDFGSAQMRGGLEASRPRASPATDVTGHSTEVLDVDAGFLAEYGNTAAAVKMPPPHMHVSSSSYACILRQYGSGSEDADPSHPDEGRDVIDVDQEVVPDPDYPSDSEEEEGEAEEEEEQQQQPPMLKCKLNAV